MTDISTVKAGAAEPLGCRSFANKAQRRRLFGFSLIELMISVGIMATTLLLVVGVFTNVMRASRKSVDLTAGTLVAESVMNRELYSIMTGPDKAAFFKDGTVPAASSHNLQAGEVKPNELLSGTERLNETVFTYKMYAKALDLTDPGAGAAEGSNAKSVSDKNRVVKVDVVVWWWAEGAKNGEEPANGTDNTRQGYGILRTELTRLVNQNSKF